MGRNYKKRTTVSKDSFGNKVIETEWIPKGGGCGVIVLLFILYMFFFGGC